MRPASVVVAAGGGSVKAESIHALILSRHTCRGVPQ